MKRLLVRRKPANYTQVGAPLDGGASSKQLLRFGCKGFTLVESIVATVVFAMTMLGVYACLIKAYQYVQLTRYRDEARSVLLSYVDQFQRLDTTDKIDDKTYIRPLFTPTSAAMGRGLNWGRLSNDTGHSSTLAVDGPFKEVPLGQPPYQLTGRVTRVVLPVQPATVGGVMRGEMLPWNTSTASYRKAPGYMLMGIFTIEYTLPSGKVYSQRLSALRSVP